MKFNKCDNCNRRIRERERCDLDVPRGSEPAHIVRGGACIHCVPDSDREARDENAYWEARIAEAIETGGDW